MPRLMGRLPAVLLALATLAGCAHGPLPERDQLHASLRFTNAPRALKLSLFAAPFFRDDSRRLLSAQPPDEVELLVTPKGERIAPGPVEEVLPAGTRVRVVALRFPGTMESFTRPLMTPRDRPWVELALDGRAPTPAYVLVLRPDLKTEDEVAAEIDKLLTTDDVAAEVAKLSEADQRAVREKVLVPGTTTRALELAFGTPAMKKIHGEGASVLEEWTWRSDVAKRTAFVRDGVVEKVELPLPRDESTATR